MAKLGSYYGLCPLIDHRSLIGISDDSENGVLLVTLGKNIAIKYKLSDQRQLHSWRTKDKFTSPVIFNRDEEKYFAVFNQTHVRTWTRDEENIDVLKKYKFTSLIHTIFSYKNKSFIVFQNGAVSLLGAALKRRKNLDLQNVVDNETDFIADILCASLRDDIYVGLLVNSNGDNHFVWFVFNESNDNNGFTKIKLNREGLNLTGYTAHGDQNTVKLITVWSDAKVFVYQITPTNHLSTVEPPGDSYTLLESISCKQLVTMASLNDDYMAIYGAAPNEEGATLIIYNLQFRVVQSRLAFKMFSMGTKMWLIENNLLLCIGQNLAVVPFTLETEQLAALVGSHKVSAADEIDSDIKIVHKLEVADWGYCSEKNDDDIPKNIKASVLEYTEQGWPESIICETLISEYIEKEDVKLVSSCLDYFRDISEKCLVKILNFCLSVDSRMFSDKHSFTSVLQPQARCDLMDKILTKSFSDVLFVPQLRSEIGINNIVVLLKYIMFLLSNEVYCLPSYDVIETEAKLIEWGCVIFDANYQRILLTRDEAVFEVLKNFRTIVHEYLNRMEEFKKLSYLLCDLKRNKLNSIPVTNRKYCIEELKLY